MQRGARLAIGLLGVFATVVGGASAPLAQVTTKPAYIIADVDIFDQAGYLRLQLAGRSTRLGDSDRDHGQIDVGRFVNT